MAITSGFDAGAGSLLIGGDALDNAITTSRNAAGAILVDGGAVAVQGGTPTVANTSLIGIFGQGGNDTITLDQANGALPAAFVVGGDGNDVVFGGAGGDQLIGQAGNDTLLGGGGFDFILGGDGNDVLTGGDGDDEIFGEAGDDRIIWNPGDDSDRAEGGDGTDTLEVNGGNGAETFTITPNGARVRVDRVNPAPFNIDAGTIENIVINANGGDDTITASNGLAGLVKLTLDGGAGNDLIVGGDGADLFLGGDGNDVVFGGRGDDVALLGAGNDAFVWNPGDGNDTIEGQDGVDAMLFNGANINENIDISANGGRVRFFRDIANVTMDLDDVEGVMFQALGGADNVVINDVSGTDLALSGIGIDLAGATGVADGALDQVTVNGRAGNDTINIGLSNDGVSNVVSVTGSPAPVAIYRSDATDRLIVNGGGGNDTINASALTAGAISLTLDGGAGNDLLVGSLGADAFFGDDGNDVVFGGRGDDTASLGAGNDAFVWNPGDGSDTVEGQDGVDALLFNGANINENIDISANGERVRFVRDVAVITMDLNDVEGVMFNALGGADNIVIGDVSGTDLALSGIGIDLAGATGVGDGQVDTVTVGGRNGDETININSANDGVNDLVSITGSPATVNIYHAEATDRLVVNSLGGDDVINASGLVAGGISLTVNAGQGEDVVIGSQGDDLVNGGDGNDTAFLGAGDDVFVWNPGDDNDTVEGQAGTDTLLFNGANVAENIDISANGGRVRFFRDIANVTMDMDDTETIEFNALGGADRIVVNDMSGTDLTEVTINLAANLAAGGGDGQADTIVINATNGDDIIIVAGDGTEVSIFGLATAITITGFEADNDRIVINGLGGDDVIQASGLAANSIQLTADGGDGDDILVGGSGNDTLLGGEGDDTLDGGPGLDVLDGGPGDNVIIQGAVAAPDPFLI
jgi:Ca2+-binding RTX toxin-like protein